MAVLFRGTIEVVGEWPGGDNDHENQLFVNWLKAEVDNAIDDLNEDGGIHPSRQVSIVVNW